MTNIPKIHTQNSTVSVPKHTNSSFRQSVVREHVISCYLSTSKEQFDLESAVTESQEGLVALNAKGAIQEMLSAQMLSVHQLQQTSIAYANNTNHLEAKRYYSNTAIKLANCFVQQATLLAKLQGNLSPHILIKNVEVNDGGQAVVGAIQGGSMGKAQEK